MFLQPLVIDSILRPCSDKYQAGSDLRLDRSRFRPLRNQYNVARTGFRQLLQQPDASERDQLVKTNTQNWESLSENLVEILTRDTKDLELVSWLCECQLFSKTPWQCLLTALKTLSRIIELYWQDCHPGGISETEGRDVPDITRRVAVLKTLFGEGGDSGLLVMPSRLCPLIGETTLGDCMAADRRGDSLTLKSELITLLPQEADTLKRRIQTLFDMRRTVKEIDGRLADVCEGNWIAGCQPLLDIIETVIRWLDFICAEEINDWPKDQSEQGASDSYAGSDTAEQVVTDEVPEAAESNGNGNNSVTEEAEQWNIGARQTISSTGAVGSRLEAYRLLQQLADYFRTAEPHSPVTCLLDRAVTWGQMSLEELMKELLSGHQRALDRVSDLTGLLATSARLPDISRSMGNGSPSGFSKPPSTFPLGDMDATPPSEKATETDSSQTQSSISTADMSDVGSADQAEDDQETESASSGGFSQQLM
ncbi:type VI secretion system ImpA family N-terminal domain-containing protein [Sansalvadorimonas sp. 2012CJ34-2]|uniref:Type VI secretion system ImpA family N-terminal domain-containing protein n=1 Tax=Parendozoicomonas callyspongiae TaxID=2942213 RepID=A0ABT0PI74_9GAMM|nr:type VI secretion system ImpA family N-terminal domain-containing protein [Sansalvadorimonas sp. 2012CJ34-2]MCL6271099.1 type VI secretion system ImpA family N-terminal domain-containing protein [Sansalvadorimonas sp. 2012CJ34-2]